MFFQTNWKPGFVRANKRQKTGRSVREEMDEETPIFAEIIDPGSAH